MKSCTGFAGNECPVQLVRFKISLPRSPLGVVAVNTAGCPSLMRPCIASLVLGNSIRPAPAKPPTLRLRRQLMSQNRPAAMKDPVQNCKRSAPASHPKLPRTAPASHPRSLRRLSSFSVSEIFGADVFRQQTEFHCETTSLSSSTAVSTLE